MTKRIGWLLTSTLGWACACQQQEPVAYGRSLPEVVAVTASTTEADANRLVQHLSRTLALSANQTRQLHRLTLAQAKDEQRMWLQLADTTCRQLRSIARHYDGQVQQLLTAQQYAHFAQLRAAALQRRAQRATQQAMQSNTPLRNAQ